jgi:hypothetical protein
MAISFACLVLMNICDVGCRAREAFLFYADILLRFCSEFFCGIRVGR